jgi:hypothetical protein
MGYDSVPFSVQMPKFRRKQLTPSTESVTNYVRMPNQNLCHRLPVTQRTSAVEGSVINDSIREETTLL